MLESEARNFERYIEEGPDALSGDELRGVLRWREEHPTEATRIRARLEAAAREEADKAALHDAWVSQGGDPRDFEKRWPELRAEHQASRLRDLQAGADAEAFHLTARNF